MRAVIVVLEEDHNLAWTPRCNQCPDLSGMQSCQFRNSEVRTGPPATRLPAVRGIGTGPEP